METQKIVNLLNDSYDESSKFATRNWYVINDQNRTNYGGNDESIKFETKVIKLSLCIYSNAYILVIGDIAATGGNENFNTAFKNCTISTRCVAHMNDEHIVDNMLIIIEIHQEVYGSLEEMIIL